MKPQRGIITTTYRCNAKCVMCNIWKHPSDPSLEIKASDLVSLPSLKGINVTGGEPFLREDLAEIIEVLLTKGDRVVVSTNGYYTDRIVKLAEKFPQVGYRVSLEGMSKANDELRGIKGGFDRGVATLKRLQAMGVKDLGIAITVSDRNAKDLVGMYELAESMGVEFATAVVHNSFYFHKFDNRIKDPEMVAGEFEKLVRKLLKTWSVKNWYRAYFNAGIIERVCGKARPLPCTMGTDIFFVGPYGDVKPCNALDYTIGNIKRTDFMELWNGPKAVKMREAVRKCDKQCWMIGSASPAMKSNFWVVTKWVLKAKLSRKRGL